MSVAATVPTPAEVRWAHEARKGRGRLYPSTVFYTVYGMGVFTLALRSHPLAAVAWFAAGVGAWTLLEYYVHRYILHGRFPKGPTPYHWFTHKYFDHLHWEHHARPWDGAHINGRIRDTLPFALAFMLLSARAPVHTWPAFVAGLLQAYVVEEWVHHSVHFYHFRNPYFRYIRRHHLYHHSPKGSGVGYGLTNGFWDVVWRTRIPEEDRRALYTNRREALRRLRPPLTPSAGATAEVRQA